MSRAKLRRPRIEGLAVAMLLCCGFLAACTMNGLDAAPDDPSRPWTPTPSMQDGKATSAEGSTTSGYSVPAEPEVSVLTPTPGLSATREYSLPELIDIAQEQNPATRLAWQRARQAALATGMVKASYLPFIAANVIGGYQQVSASLPVPVAGQDTVSNTISGVSPQIALQWLVFDFGQRDALHKAAKQNSLAANILFNGTHQQIIYDVTRAYYLYGAARSRVQIAGQNLSNSKQILAAAEARSQKGLGTSVEVAQARQQVAQAQFGLVQSQGMERDAYQALLAAVGISPMTKLKVRDSNGRRLPSGVGAPTEAMIKVALARRPDVLASFSAMKASEAGIAAAQAEFLPKVYLGAVAAGGNSNLSASGLPTIGQQSSTTGVLVGATVPLFDGGLRDAQLKNAQSVAAASSVTFQKTRDAAAREIVASADALRSALASYKAATALTDAAKVTYDAALDSYRAGVGNITVLTAADSGLLDARQARSDAYAASLVAAANLAFVLGDMTSADRAGGAL